MIVFLKFGTSAKYFNKLNVEFFGYTFQGNVYLEMGLY
jgi:hypothetical protein